MGSVGLPVSEESRFMGERDSSDACRCGETGKTG
jgi:hypothetical protein